MRVRFVFLIVAIAAVSAGLSSLATWQFAERQLVVTEDILTLPIAAGPNQDRPGRFRVAVNKARFYRTPEDRMGADVSLRVIAIQRGEEWVPVGTP